MDLIILNDELIEVSICDIYQSLVWVERYNSFGEFELVVQASTENIQRFREGWYLEWGESEEKMIIEDIFLSTEHLKIPTMKITGRSPESILDRRIIMNQININGSLQDGIRKILTDNVIDPLPKVASGVNPRKIPGVKFVETKDPRITKMLLELQVTYDDVYTTIRDICAKEHLGFSLNLMDNGDLLFELYLGVDRSAGQTVVPSVVFSPNNDNLINSQYFETSRNLRTHITIGGEGEGVVRVVEHVNKDTKAMGLHRRELFVDARDLSSNQGSEEDEIPIKEYRKMLVDRGNVKAAEWVRIKEFDGEADTSNFYIYNKDFFMGDIVSLRNEFKMEADVRVTEIVYLLDDSGMSIVPTFTLVE